MNEDRSVSTFAPYFIIVFSVWAALSKVSLARQNVPRVLLLEGKIGAHDSFINGEYKLLPTLTNGRPTWFRNVPQHRDERKYILFSDCFRWLISAVPDGGGADCRGRARVRNCVHSADPWDCGGHWEFWQDERWTPETEIEPLVVTPLWGPPRDVFPGRCSRRDERRLVRKFGGSDIVIPWINGSDPVWLAAREEICEDMKLRWMWPDLIARSHLPTVACLAGRVAIMEAVAFAEAGGCEKPGAENESACLAFYANGSEAIDIGLTGKGSKCYRNFDPCSRRVGQIADHDELRYLVRSLESNLPWITGRIIIVAPAAQRPVWLAQGFEDSSRVRLMTQESLLSAAMASPQYIPWSQRRGLGGYAPDRIFNDFPVEHALAFLPNASKHILLIQDDLLFARKLRPCDILTRPPYSGMKLFARPFRGDHDPDPYEAVFMKLLGNSARLWESSGDIASAQTPSMSHIVNMDMDDLQSKRLSELKTLLRKLGVSEDEIDEKLDVAEETGQRSKDVLIEEIRAWGVKNKEPAICVRNVSHDRSVNVVRSPTSSSWNPYYSSYHTPTWLHVPTLRQLWRQFPDAFSKTVDTPFRHANLTDIVGLHHAEVASHSRHDWNVDLRRIGRRGVKQSSTPRILSRGSTIAGSRVVDMDFHMADAEQLPMKDRFIKEIKFRHGTSREFSEKMKGLRAEPQNLPVMLSFQDAFVTAPTPVMQCLRERWLTQLLPARSSAEESASPPDRCSRHSVSPMLSR